MSSIRTNLLRQTQASRTFRRVQPIASSSRNLTIPPPLCSRSLLIRSQPNPAWSMKRWNSSIPDNNNASSKADTTSSENPQIEAPDGTESKPQKIGQIEPRLQMTFTCTANDCGHRSTHEFSKRSYTKGLVLVQCPECKSRHLIADHIGWFKESLEGGKLKTVEDLLRAKGEKIKKGRINMDGDIEYEGDD